MADLLVVSLPELDRAGVRRNKHSTTKYRVERGGEEGREYGLHKQHGRVYSKVDV